MTHPVIFLKINSFILETAQVGAAEEEGERIPYGLQCRAQSHDLEISTCA